MTNDNETLRARQLGLPFKGRTGPFNAITDVKGIKVGFETLIENAPRAGRRLPVRTGVTAIIPHAEDAEPPIVYAGIHRYNGNGEMTGSHWIEDGGYFLGPVLLTNTHSVGIAHHAAIKWMLERYPDTYNARDLLWVMPVVAETYDGLLNDINGQHVTAENVFSALNSAATGRVAEGNSGGGAGMITYGFKGGTGTSSRLVEVGDTEYTLGVLVQANHGQRDWLTICGVPVGEHLRDGTPASQLRERGSIIVVVATDLPLAPHQLKRIARRCTIGIGRNGTPGGNNSGDIFLAFSTANKQPMRHKSGTHLPLEIINDERFDPIYSAVVDCVEEAVVNAMLAAESLGGTSYDRVRVDAINAKTLVDLLARYQRL